MEEIYQQTHDNHMLIGICILKEKIKSPFQECYENVLKNVERPHYYNDLNYWVAIGGLSKPYNEQDIEKSRVSEETIRYFLKQDRQMFLDNIF
ncbi:hypothetical protein RO21_10080 [[Actinobacillus] muris]|uniref:Uncharacterized protein n=1 Tax=Muribacter muris TaxID=67855 RepID=A0A0J5P4W5_9PAST|nr:hypothetical protein [Muribacter muris]KMK50735.1 hypothetical protein RO21_10080 [[Actinobacillus] muris] [Muribacter muris]